MHLRWTAIADKSLTLSRICGVVSGPAPLPQNQCFYVDRSLALGGAGYRRNTPHAVDPINPKVNDMPPELAKI
jgi:hypothetical protein